MHTLIKIKKVLRVKYHHLLLNDEATVSYPLVGLVLRDLHLIKVCQCYNRDR